MVDRIIAFRRVRNLRNDYVLHRRCKIDAELIVLLCQAQILLAGLGVFLRIARDEEMGHHPGHQEPDRRRTLRLPVDVFDIDGFGDDAQLVADAAEMVDGQVSQAHSTELKAEEVEVEDGDRVREAIDDGVGESVLVEPLPEEVQTVFGPCSHWEDFDFILQERPEDGDIVTEEFLVDVELVAWGSALDADDWTLEETGYKDRLDIGMVTGSADIYLLNSLCSYVAIGSAEKEKRMNADG